MNILNAGLTLIFLLGSSLYSAEPNHGAGAQAVALARVQRVLGHCKPVVQRSVETHSAGASRIFLKYPGMLQAVKKTFGTFFIKNGPLIREIERKEDELFDTHYVMYHAQQQGLRPYHDLLRYLYEYEFGKPVRDDYTFLRWWHDCSQYQDVNAFLDAYPLMVKGLGNVNDNDPAINKQIMSINFPWCGSPYNSGECSLAYFSANRSITHVGCEEVLSAILKHYGFDTAYAKKFSDLGPLITTPEGSLFQIFIPKKEVDTYVYFSKPWGIPISKIDEISDVYNLLKQRYTSSSEIMDLFLQGSSKLNKFVKDMQGRLLANRQFLSPDRNTIKVYRHLTTCHQAAI